MVGDKLIDCKGIKVWYDYNKTVIEENKNVVHEFNTSKADAIIDESGEVVSIAEYLNRFLNNLQEL